MDVFLRGNYSTLVQYLPYSHHIKGLISTETGLLVAWKADVNPRALRNHNIPGKINGIKL